MDKFHDVLVVGAGPAGQNAAYNLAKAGISVCLIDGDKLPKSKVCGGALRSTVVRRFPYLEQIIKNITLAVIRKATVYSPKSYKVTASPDHDLVFLISRFDFSRALLKLCQEAGVEQCFGQRVRRIVREKESMTAFLHSGEKIKAKAVIGCDGVNSLVARELDLNTRTSADYFGLASEQELEFDINFPNDEVLIYYGFQNRVGYSWVFPKGKLINVGSGYNNIVKGIIPQQVHQSFIHFLKEQKVLPNNFPVMGIRTWAVPNSGPMGKTFGDRVLLCGDAAGFVNPMTAEGMYYALASGELAAKVMIQSVKTNDYSSQRLSVYQKLWQKEFGREFKAMLSIQKFLANHSGMVDLVIKTFKNDTRVGNLLADFFTGRISYQRLKLGLLPKIGYLFAKAKVKGLFGSKS